MSRLRPKIHGVLSNSNVQTGTQCSTWNKRIRTVDQKSHKPIGQQNVISERDNAFILAQGDLELFVRA